MNATTTITVKVDQYVVRRTVSADGVQDHSVWEPAKSHKTHRTITRINGSWYGRLDTRRIETAYIPPTASLASLPFICEAFYYVQSLTAAKIIAKAFPDAAVMNNNERASVN